MAQRHDAVSRPVDWDKAVAAAYLHQIGHTQEESAKGAGVGRRTVQRWMVSPWWHEACEEASDRWLKHLKTQARIGLTKCAAEDGALALKVMERIDMRLAPPARKLEHSGPDGGPIETRELSDAELRERAASLTNRVAALTASPNGNGSKPSKNGGGK